MRPEEGDEAFLWDMWEQARRLGMLLRGVTREQFMSDENLRMAVERRIEIIGEAASRVSAAFREQHPDIPWRQIIGQRNVLIHEYGAVIPELVWVSATEDVPDLLRLLAPLIPQPPENA